MFRKISCLFGILTLSLIGLSSSVLAQDKPLATGLNNPRNLTFGSDGTLYIAEAGSGGDTSADGPFSKVKIGDTGQITAVDKDGKQSALISKFVSMDQSGQVDGPSAIYVTDDSYWVALGLGPKNPPTGSHVSSVVQLDRKDLSVREVIDFGAWEVKNNPDKGQELTSNPVDIAVDKDGKLYIADASGNSVLTWTKQDGIQLFAGWPIDADGNVPPAVPTAVSIGPDGDIYIGFLSGYPFPTKGARIERYSPDGKLKETYDNLTLVTDVLVTQDGTIYAVQFADSFTDSGYNPKSGSIVTVSKDGLKTIADKLNFPYGLAQNADGKLFIAVNTAFGDKDSGQVISIGST